MLGMTDRDTNLIMKFMTNNKFIHLDGETLICSDLALLKDRLVHYHKEGKRRN